MKHYIFSIIFILSVHLLHAQETNSTATTSMTFVLVSNIAPAKAAIDSFIAQKHLRPIDFLKDKIQVHVVLSLSEEDYAAYNKMVNKLGYISSQKVALVDFNSEIIQIDEEIKQLIHEREQYQMLAANAEPNSSERYYTYREKMMTIENTINIKTNRKTELTELQRRHHCELTVTEETNSTMEYSSSWINMPGIEYSFLKTEQPQAGTTPRYMNGILLKYMFNTGKSYGTLGLYKAAADDSAAINETYIFALGQDFYSRHLGRGQRKFLNLYTSFNLGVYVSSSEKLRTTSWFASPYVGLELFKTRYILIDNKVGYFMPYRNNRSQRGLLYNVSFNFAF